MTMTKAVSSAFRFHGYRLEQLHMEFDPSIEPDREFEHSFEFNTTHSAVDLLEEESGRTTLVSLELVSQWEPSPGPFSFSLVLVGAFEQGDDLSAEQYRQFVEVHAPAVLFAHARPIVRFAMAEAKQPVRLPLINLRESLKRRREEEQERRRGGESVEESEVDMEVRESAVEGEQEE